MQTFHRHLKVVIFFPILRHDPRPEARSEAKPRRALPPAPQDAPIPAPDVSIGYSASLKRLGSLDAPSRLASLEPQEQEELSHTAVSRSLAM